VTRQARLLQMQALGVLACPKPTTADEVFALCDVLNNRQNAGRGTPTRLRTWATGFRLSPTETTVLELGAAGLTNEDIASEIQRSKRTVDTHWQRSRQVRPAWPRQRHRGGQRRQPPRVTVGLGLSAATSRRST